MAQPETQYARAGDVDIAYQVVGEGPIDVVWAFGLMTQLEVMWEEPSLAAMFRRLAEFSRLILFDRRGCGLSDRGDRHLTPTLEERVDDIVAVLDDIGSRRASIFSVSEGGALASLFASMHPQRTRSIIIYGGIARILRDAAHPWGWLDSAEIRTLNEPVVANWGTIASAAEFLRLLAPSIAEDDEYVEWFARLERQALGRDAIEGFLDAIAEYDVDDVLPAVRVPTLVLHRTGDTAIPVSHGHRIASRIPGAQLVELPGVDHLPYIGASDAVVDAIRAHLDGRTETPPTDRRLVTLLATDASGADVEAFVTRHLRRFDAVLVPTQDTGVLAHFGTATKAVRCGLGIVDAAGRRGVDLRVGIHTGECEVSGPQVRGVPVQVPVGLIRLAKPGQVLVTRTVRDIVPGSGIRFADERQVRLPGIPGEQVVLAVVDPSTSEGGPPKASSESVFRLDGEYWILGFEGRAVTMKDSKGMHDLAVLLAEPGRERHVLDLWSRPTEPGVSPADAAVEGLRSRGPAEPVIDETARDQYRHRIEQLDREITEAEANGEHLAAANGREERDRLVDELAAAYGLGGRARRMPDEVERARKTVRRRINDALSRIEKANPTLGRHLRHSVHTGAYCSYTPERDVRWVVTAPTCGR